MIRTKVVCGCGTVIATYTKEEDKPGVIERETAADCETCQASGSYGMPVVLPVQAQIFVSDAGSAEVASTEHKAAEVKTDESKSGKTPKERYRKKDRRRRLQKRQDELQALRDQVERLQHLLEAATQARKGGKRERVLHLVVVANEGVAGQSTDARRETREEQVRPSAGRRR